MRLAIRSSPSPRQPQLCTALSKNLGLVGSIIRLLKAMLSILVFNNHQSAIITTRSMALNMWHSPTSNEPALRLRDMDTDTDMAPEDVRPIHGCCRNECTCRYRDDDQRSVAPTEITVILRRDLGVFDVAALIINKQIGAGIFTTPGLVLHLTQSKTIGTVLWFCGGLWSFLSVLIYVEFGSAFPFNGGELIYLDEVFKTPELLATILYSSFFLVTPNTAGNAIQFAKLILLAANADFEDTQRLDQRLISFIAIVGLTGVCFIHYFSRNSGLFLNIFFVVFKIALLIVTIICGGIASTRVDKSKGSWSWGSQGGPSNVLAALVYVIYSYQGWENANYVCITAASHFFFGQSLILGFLEQVGGELNVKKSALKWGAFLGIATTTLLYTLVTVIYDLVCPFDDLTQTNTDLDIVLNFAPTAFGGTSGAQGFKICIALSALGNVIAVVYTSVKVKQQIARQCFMPFYKYFASADKHFGTPLGALILHWVVTVIWIGATPNTTGGYGFIIGAFIYGQLIIGFFTGFAFFWIRHTFEADTARRDILDPAPKWNPIVLENRYLRYACTLVFMGINLMVLVEGARSSGSPPPWLWPPIFGGLFLLGFIYWYILWIMARRSNENSMLEVRIVKKSRKPVEEQDRAALMQAMVEGNTRVVIYKFWPFEIEKLDYQVTEMEPLVYSFSNGLFYCD
ncbi:hypothetical protein UA08_06716 [Talaromyces atroroseus]|uniref:Amino acid permease/ SLC12A domain-containing protein n=1 Tax=Talaromyces atroroseus TaxID=1441469 RepID=A0A225AKW4_TALAT|nr:hypothetical protein UA08_06716 [Talaromyces atroroseus]OKL57878.1 hypothetical protein UA08_06716 [Talaromyces atroroseus]